MATSLSKLKNQIQKLQKQADSIQTNVISRIKKEIAQHGLTVEDLFSADIRSVGNGSVAEPKKAAKAKKSGGDKPAKFADGAGNFWHGIGKRPGWIHDALEAGRKLEEFLIGKTTKTTKPAASVKAPKKKAVASKKAAPAKVAKAEKAPAAKKATKAKTAAPKAAAKAPAKKATKATVAAKPASKAAPKKAVKPAAAATGAEAEPQA